MNFEELVSAIRNADEQIAATASKAVNRVVTKLRNQRLHKSDHFGQSTRCLRQKDFDGAGGKIELNIKNEWSMMTNE